MNRYKTAPGLGPSKASATTICQKCLQKGHYSYECKSALQSRPYVSRASRTQQLRNPKLKPALTETKLEEKAQQPEQAKAERSESLPDYQIDKDDGRPTKRQRRSPSISSVDSVSTISTKASNEERPKRASISKSRTTAGESRSPVARQRRSVDHRSNSPPARRYDDRPASRRRRSRSPYHDRRRGSKRDSHRDSSPPPPRRGRSLSPYSRRIALTQAMNMR